MATIFIFGPSCGGKSTLAKALQKELGDGWARLDRDVLIDEEGCHKTEVNQVIDEKIAAIKQTIVDAQIPWRDRRENELYFLVLPPLQVLLERDAKRTSWLNRSEERAQQCQTYVINTHNTLNAWPKEGFDGCFDSSVLSVAEEVATIYAALNTERL